MLRKGCINKQQLLKQAVLQCMFLGPFSLAISQHQPVNKDTGNCSVSIFLTFDDGPRSESWHLLSFASSDTVPLNVFLVGENVYNTKDGKAIFQAYTSNVLIETGNRSFRHASKKYKAFYREPGKVINDILLNEDSLHLSNKLLRLPGRNVWRVNNKQRNDLEDAAVAADSLASTGYKIFGWDLEWRYDTITKSYASAEQVIQMIRHVIAAGKTFTPGAVVILCHDPMLENENARIQLQLFARKVKITANWHFEHLSKYPGGNFSPVVADFFH